VTDVSRFLVLALLDLALLAGWLAIPLGLGGNFILLALALVVALTTHFTAIGWAALGVIAAAVAAGEGIEAVLGSLMARRYGSSRWGMAGAFLGGLLGGILGTAILPVIGSLIGSFLGSAFGAVGAELLHGARREAGMRAGWGAFLGKAMATGIKMGIGAGIIVLVVLRTH
jgi:uncharacterized protein